MPDHDLGKGVTPGLVAPNPTKSPSKWKCMVLIGLIPASRVAASVYKHRYGYDAATRGDGHLAVIHSISECNDDTAV